MALINVPTLQMSKLRLREAGLSCCLSLGAGCSERKSHTPPPPQRPQGEGPPPGFCSCREDGWVGSREHRNQGPDPDSSSFLFLPPPAPLWPPPQLINRRPLFRPGMDGAGGRRRGVFTHRLPGRQRPRPGHGPVREGGYWARGSPSLNAGRLAHKGCQRNDYRSVG